MTEIADGRSHPFATILVREYCAEGRLEGRVTVVHAWAGCAGNPGTRMVERHAGGGEP